MKNLSEVKQALKEANHEGQAKIIEVLKLDKRKGAQQLVKQYEAQQAKMQAMHEKYQRLLIEEKKLINNGAQWVAGIDEVGRGPLAGPVVAACVVFKPGVYIVGVDDSKKLSKKRREELYDQIMDQAVAVGVGRVDVAIIDQINILNATKRAMGYAIQQCNPQPDHLLLDAVTLNDIDIPQKAIIKGDSKSHSIAAASIVAKVVRDREMEQLAEKYPQYAFNRNMGYGTKEHMDALEEIGLSPVHRRSFCKRFL